MTTERDDEPILEAATVNRRSMLKRVLIGGAVAYTAPIVATFALDGAAAQPDQFDRSGFPGGGNLDRPDFPHGSNLDSGDWEGGRDWDWDDVYSGDGGTDPVMPEPTPTAAPATAPKKPAAKPEAKKPKSGGSAAPNFTG